MKNKFLAKKISISVLSFALMSVIILSACGKKDSDIETDGSVEENTDAITDELEIEEETSVPIVCKDYYYDNKYSDDGSECYFNVGIEGLSVLNDGFDELKESLKANSIVCLDEAEWRMDSMDEDLEYVTEDEYMMSTLPWWSRSSIDVLRNDEKVLGFVRTASTFVGGAHPNTYFEAFSYDVQTGEEIKLDDLLQDKEGFENALKECIKAYPDSSELYEEWEETVHKDVYEIDGYHLIWSLTNDGIQVIFGPYELSYYAFGDVTVTVKYDDYPEVFTDLYKPEKKTNLVCLYTNRDYESEFSFDADNDGTEEIVKVTVETEYNEETYETEFQTPSVTFGVKGDRLKKITLGEALGVGRSFIMEADDNHKYLYIELYDYNDYQSLQIIDISDPNEGPVDLGINNSGAFYGFTPTNVDEIYIEDRIYMMGTYGGYYKCHIGEGGQLVADNAEYTLFTTPYGEAFGKNDSAEKYRTVLTAAKDFETYIYSDLKQKDKRVSVSIKEGTKLYPYKTDGSTYMTFITDDGNYLDLCYDEEMDEESWEHTIGGEKESELLDGIVYAG